MSDSEIIEDRYLGDGVYVSFDGYSIVLDLRAQPPTYPITKVALEPPVFEKLMQFNADLRNAREGDSDE